MTVRYVPRPSDLTKIPAVVRELFAREPTPAASGRAPRAGLGARLTRTSAKLADAVGSLAAPTITRVLRSVNESSGAPITGDAPCLVSLTSHGARVDDVFLTIESIAAGTRRPARLVLWLDEPDDPESLPVELQRLIARGLEVRWTPRMGPYAKFYPSLPLLADDEFLVTADDDILYPKRWLERLLAAATDEPEVIHCFRAREMLIDAQGPIPYADWPVSSSPAASHANFVLGVSGAIYGPRMTRALREAGEGFRDVAPRADDIWLNVIAVRSGVRVAQLSRVPRHFPMVPGSQATSLRASNVAHDGNDPQIMASYDPAALQRVIDDSTRA